MKLSSFSRIGLLVSLAIGAAACSTTGGSGRAQEPQARPAAQTPKAPADQSVPELRASLGNPDLMVRMGAVEELGRRSSRRTR